MKTWLDFKESVESKNYPNGPAIDYISDPVGSDDSSYKEAAVYFINGKSFDVIIPTESLGDFKSTQKDWVSRKIQKQISSCIRRNMKLESKLTKLGFKPNQIDVIASICKDDFKKKIPSDARTKITSESGKTSSDMYELLEKSTMDAIQEKIDRKYPGVGFKVTGVDIENDIDEDVWDRAVKDPELWVDGKVTIELGSVTETIPLDNDWGSWTGLYGLTDLFKVSPGRSGSSTKTRRTTSKAKKVPDWISNVSWSIDNYVDVWDLLGYLVDCGAEYEEVPIEPDEDGNDYKLVFMGDEHNFSYDNEDSLENLYYFVKDRVTDYSDYFAEDSEDIDSACKGNLKKKVNSAVVPEGRPEEVKLIIGIGGYDGGTYNIKTETLNYYPGYAIDGYDDRLSETEDWRKIRQARGEEKERLVRQKLEELGLPIPAGATVFTGCNDTYENGYICCVYPELVSKHVSLYEFENAFPLDLDNDYGVGPEYVADDYDGVRTLENMFTSSISGEDSWAGYVALDQ